MSQTETRAATDVVSAIEELTPEIAAAAAAVDRERRFPRGALNELAARGGFGLMAPRELGGGGTLADLARVCEALGGACASTGMVFLMHSVTVATTAAAGADDVVRELASGALGTLAFSERATGAHFYAPALRAERRNGTLSVSGRKGFVTSGGEADIYLLLLEGELEGTTDVFAVRRDAGGMTFAGEWEGIGMAGNSSIALELDGVELAEEQRVGAAGAGGELVFGAVAPVFLAGLAAVNVGIAGAAARAATEQAAGRRYPDGSSVAEVQSVQHQLAEMDIRVTQARLLVREAARLADADDPAALVALMESKVAATDTSRAVTELALEVAGGQGYTPALPFERHLRDARAGAVMAPTNGVLRTWIGKALAGLPVP